MMAFDRTDPEELNAVVMPNEQRLRWIVNKRTVGLAGTAHAFWVSLFQCHRP